MKRKLIYLTWLLLLTASLSAQMILQGTVTDEDGQPIPGATILIKGTTMGAVTDLDGNYELANVEEGATLVFTFIGMIEEEAVVSNQTQIDMQLLPDLLSIDAVVVVGYGEVKKKDLTSAVTLVTAEEIVKMPTASPMEALQGRVPGMDVTRSSGSAGSGVEIRIRGNRSIGDPNDPETFKDQNEPLYVIDGVQGGSINDLNPNDIESISILKDASATAIYGSQGANGVIIITTKKGSAGRSVVSYNGYYGVSGFTPYPDVRLSDEYIEFRKEAYRTTEDWDDEIHDENDYGIMFNDGELAAIENNQWVDWLDLIQQNGQQQNHMISFSGGNEKTQSYFSLGYLNEEGILKNDVYDRYSARININHTASRWVSLGMQSQFTYIEQDRRKDPFSTSVSIVPLGEAYDENGNIIINPIAGNPDEISPLTDERNNIAIDNAKQQTGTLNGYLEIKPLQGLTFRSNLGTNIRFSRRGKFNDATSLAQKNSQRTYASVENKNNSRLNWDNILTYSNIFGNHSMSVTALTSYILGVKEESFAGGYDQDNPNNLFHKLDATTSDGRKISSLYTQSKLISYAGRINYSFQDKYLISATGRYDGASVLSTGEEGDFFPSISAAWKLHKESFISEVSAINELKLRGSWGVTGTSSVAPYSTQSGVSSFPIGIGYGVNTAYKFNELLGTSDLGWEKSKTINLGLDFSILNNRIVATIDVYNTKTDDVLLKRSLPRMTGIQNVYQNVGATQNQGIELLLSTININRSDFMWKTTATFSKNEEKITELIGNEDIIDGETNSLIIGEPIQSFYTFKKEGIWQLGEEEQMGIYNIPINTGDIKIADLNTDSIYDAEDRTVIGSAVPKWFFGFENTFTYKNFELSVYLFARWGQMIEAEFLGRYNPSGEGNGPSYFDYWTPNNPSNDYPRPRRGYAINQYFGYQTLSFVDGSYFKIKNVRLSYTLPNNIIEKSPFSRFQIYFTTNNLLTVTKSHLIRYYDPERGGSESAPLSKQFLIGVNVDF